MSTVGRLTTSWEKKILKNSPWVKSKLNVFWISTVFKDQEGREGDSHLSLHYEEALLWRQGRASFSEQLVTDLQSWGSPHGWFLGGLDDATFMNTESEARWHILMDDAALLCLTRRLLPSPALDVPWCALAWWALLSSNYQSAGIVSDCALQREWHPRTPTMSASSLARIHGIMTASAQLMPLKGRATCLWF